jgi:hypothetical protein
MFINKLHAHLLVRRLQCDLASASGYPQGASVAVSSHHLSVQNWSDAGCPVL